MGKHKPHWFDADSQSSSYVTAGQRGEDKTDDLLYHATLSNLRGHIRAAGLRPRREDLADQPAADAHPAAAGTPDTGHSGVARHFCDQYAVCPREGR